MPKLDWLTRPEDERTVASIPYRLLEAVPELSHGDEQTENMLIQGDNLEALKSLLPYYAGRVKCIYADPPFNTQQAFPDYDDNLEHTKWLSMVYPALELQRELLSMDGTLFIHIDDNELGYLIAIADEVMGRKNRIAVVTFKQGAATGHKAINPGPVNTTNFVLIYARQKPDWKPNRLFTGRQRDNRYNQFLTNPEAPYAQWKLEPLSKAFSRHSGKKIGVLKKELGDGYEDVLNDFVIANATRVFRPARPDFDAVSEEAREMITKSQEDPTRTYCLRRADYSDMYFLGGERLLSYREKLKPIDGELIAGEPLTTLWDDLLSNNLHNEGGVEMPKGKKPEALIKRVFELSTSPKDLVLDAYLGSGTTAAVAHKMGLQYIGIERGEHAFTKCQPRLTSVVGGDQSGVSKSVRWKGGGGFRFYRLAGPIFDEKGHINPSIRFDHLAAHVWFAETRTPLSPKRRRSPLLGKHGGTAYYLLFNGILGDKRPDGGNVLTRKVLSELPAHDGPRVIYGESSRLSLTALKQLGVIFKQTPYDVKVR
ncbi:MAG TPA: site-specific DNA-methyltransferase [Terracidiphilus sp.]|nr:site-specific DNA-methyltransferase [Terracidiphilus sp.]